MILVVTSIEYLRNPNPKLIPPSRVMSVASHVIFEYVLPYFRLLGKHLEKFVSHINNTDRPAGFKDRREGIPYAFRCSRIVCINDIVIAYPQAYSCICLLILPIPFSHLLSFHGSDCIHVRWFGLLIDPGDITP